MSPDSSFPLFLRTELQRRQERNPNYSMRTFAKTIGVSSSFLSKVLNGKKALGESSFSKIAARLQLEPEVLEKYRTRLPGFKSDALGFDPVDLDIFQHVSDWYHYAILEAVTLADFEATPQWVSLRLGITEEKARGAIERLIRLGLLGKDSDGKFKSKGKNLSTVHHPKPSLACREHERQVLQLAVRALDEVPVEQRYQTSVTIGIPSSRLAEARERIDEFRRDMAALLQRRGKRDSVYHLSVSFYPITKTENQK